MNVPHFLQWLSVAIFVLCPDDVTGQFTAAPPTCPGDTFTFRCTVSGGRSGFTIWRVGNTTSDECNLSHRSNPSIATCGPTTAFTARSGIGFGTSATSFTSTLSGTATLALNGTLVECFGPANNVDPGNRVDSSTIQILGPPSAPTLSCVELSEDVSGAVNVTVSWTLSGGDSADFYLISITTNAPQTPYGGLLNIATASVTQYELTGFMAGYEYNITIRGVNCGGLMGRESEPLTIASQAPPAPSGCNITLLYSNRPSGRLLFITSTWDSMPNSVNPDPGEACPGPSGDIIQYKITFQTGSSVATENVSIASCTAGRCSHTFEPPSNSPSSYDSVSVAAENVVGVGPARTCTTQTISTTNNVLNEEVVNVSSPSHATLNCTFLSGFTGSANCTVQYGTDPTYMNLPYSAESTETGTAGDTVSVVLRERLNSSTVYYYTVSAVSGDVTVIVQGDFITTQYSCSLMELWDLSATNASFLSDVSLLNDSAAQYPSCDDVSVGSAVLVNTTLNTATVAYYTGTTPGSRACFVCDESSEYELNTAINERVCQRDGTWSRSPTICICTLHQHLLDWHKTLIAIGVFFLVVGVGVAVLIIVYKVLNKVRWWQIPFVCLVVTAVIYSVIGVILWIAMGAVVANPPNGSGHAKQNPPATVVLPKQSSGKGKKKTSRDVCQPSWQHSRVGLITSGFGSFVLVIVLGIILPLILIIARKLYRQFYKKSEDGRGQNRVSLEESEDGRGQNRVSLEEVSGGQTNEDEEPSTSDANVQQNQAPQTDSSVTNLDQLSGVHLTNGDTTSFSQQIAASPLPNCSPQVTDDGGTNAEAAREEEMRPGVGQINTGVQLAGPNYYSVLYMAARRGEIDTVKSFANEVPDITILKDDHEMTLLHMAAEKGHLDIVKYLVGKGANKNMKNLSKRTPLHMAAEGGHYNIVKYLVEEGANVSIKDQLGWTPLHVAAGQGHMDVVIYLLEQGADISAKDIDGRMPQYVAAEEGHMDIVAYLVDNGASINITDRTGWTPLHVAADKGHLRTVECLVEKQADIDIKDRFGYTPLCVAAGRGHKDIVECLLKKRAEVNIKDDDGPTSLRIAARQGHVKIVNLLVDNGVDMNSKDGKGRTPLHIAVWVNKMDTVEYLVKKGADINIKDDGGRTPLHIAVKKNYGHTVKSLVEKGADVNISDKKGWTPLHVAAGGGYVAIVEYLVVDKQADIHVKAYNGRIALHVAVEGGHVDIVRFLVGQTPDDINRKDDDGMTPLHVAAESGRFNIVDQGHLVDKKTDINIKDNSGRTPLHIAVKGGFELTVKSLVEKGADVNMPDNEGRTPLDVAKEGRHEEIATFLTEKETKDREGSG